MVMDVRSRSSVPAVRRTSRGFTLVEILISCVILAVGILAISQTTVLGVRTSNLIRNYAEARQILAKGLEILKLLPYDDPLLSGTCIDSTLSDTTLAYRADSTNVVGRTIGPTQYGVFWNVADNTPQPRFKTIRMIVYSNKGRRLIDADYVKWR
jgi:prepilin-type N-terminal cleavage/methylation domain-containing protein